MELGGGGGREGGRGLERELKIKDIRKKFGRNLWDCWEGNFFL